MLISDLFCLPGFMDLKTELNEFLHGFARDGKVAIVNYSYVQRFELKVYNKDDCSRLMTQLLGLVNQN